MDQVTQLSELFLAVAQLRQSADTSWPKLNSRSSCPGISGASQTLVEACLHTHPPWDSLLQECGILSSPRQNQPFRALSLWLAARFKSFTKIPKTFSRLALRRQGCRRQGHEWLAAEGRKQTQTPVPAQGGTAGARRGQDISLGVKTAAFQHFCLRNQKKPREQAVGTRREGKQSPQWDCVLCTMAQVTVSLPPGPLLRLGLQSCPSSTGCPPEPLDFTSLSFSPFNFNRRIRHGH